MKAALGFFKGLKLIDDDRTLSLSCIAVIVALVRLAVIPEIDWPVLVALFLTLLNYNARKLFRFIGSRKEADEQSRLQHLEKLVADMRTSQALKR